MNDHDDSRPNPDQLLNVINQEASQKSRGKLKVFLGMVAGVGKTCSMLNAARQLLNQKVDIVVGWIETHGRKYTENLIQGIETVPRKKIMHRGVELVEMDVEAILKRKPYIVLVDELAHSNVPGSKYLKRYQDVLELLDAGINVYTTLNIQHLESRVDTVREITGIKIHETIPDSFLDRASEVVLIDLPPDELIKRLQDGNIYPEEKIETASRNFFKKGNLTALREMALRLSAERVDRELRNFKILHGIEEVWKSGHRLMVAVFASPYSDSLIRWTRRMADLLDATWVGATVENEMELSDYEKSLLSKNVSLVHQLGGEFYSTKDQDTVDGLVRVARQNNVTQIIVGKTRRGFIRNFLSGGSIVDKLLRRSGGIDIYAVSTEKEKLIEPVGYRQIKILNFPWHESQSILGIVLASWIVAHLMVPIIGYMAVGVLFLIAVSCAGLFLSRMGIFILAMLFSFIHNFFFIPPLYSLSISKPEDVLILIMYFIAAAIIGTLTNRVVAKEKMLRLREDRAILLYHFAKEITAAKTLDDVIEKGFNQIQNFLKEDCGFYLATPGNSGNQTSDELNSFKRNSFILEPKDLAVAKWVFTYGEPAGKTTDILPATQGLFLPINGSTGTLGVFGIKIIKQNDLSNDHKSLIETFLHQLAAAIERESFHMQARILKIQEKRY